MLCEGVWLPAGEVHFRDTLTALAQEGHSALYPALDAALPFVKAHRCCVDIGAHVGLWSRWLVYRFFCVEAFEPVAEHAELFRRNVHKGRLHQVALGDHAGFVGMKSFPGDSGRAHICGAGDIEMRTLDSYGFSDVDLIKIDVEGYELAVVRGAEQTLKRNQPIVIIEQRGCEVTNFGETCRDQALVWLVDLGMYPIQRIGHDVIMGWP